jgi:type IX secretion system PorP/SprF family membrane protein
MLKRIVVICVLFTLAVLKIAAQGETPMYSQYMMNGFLFNPAIAGSEGYTSFNLTSRLQWLGISDAPRTYSISFQTRLLKRSYILKRNSVKQKTDFQPTRSGRVGIGAAVITDQTGAFNRTGMQFTYAYHIFMDNSQLSFGLTGNLYQYKYSLTAEQFANPTAVSGLLTVLNKPYYIADANFGTYYLTENYYAGISVENIMQSALRLGNILMADSKLLRTYYLTGAYRIKYSHDFDLEPSFLGKFNERIAFIGDFGCKLYYKENYWFGLSVRTNKDFIAMLGVRYNKLFIGYAFDYGISNLTTYTTGSHELMLALKFGDNARRYKWIVRY